MRFAESDGVKICLSEEQEKQISSYKRIKEALCSKEAFAFDIYDTVCWNTVQDIAQQERLVGFVMLRRFAADAFFLWDFAIDSRCQNQHYGTRTLEELLKLLKEQYHAKVVTTTYRWGNSHAKYLYEKMGFAEIEVVCENDVHEVNMRLEL